MQNVNKINSNHTRSKLSQNKSSIQNNNNSSLQCYRCGEHNHKATDCTAKNLKCTFCKKPDHVQIACIKFKKINHKASGNKKLNSKSKPKATNKLDVINEVF